MNGNYNSCAFLLNSGFKVNAQDSEGCTPLHLAAQQGHHKVCELLIGRGARVNARDSFGCTPLYAAALNGHKEIGELLIGHGAKVNAQENDGFTPLHAAANRGFKEVCELLISHRASVKVRLNKDVYYGNDLWGQFTALHLAVFYNKLEVVKILLQAGADKNARAQNGRTALGIARQCGYTELVTYLKSKKK